MKKILSCLLIGVILCSLGVTGMSASAASASGIEVDIMAGRIYYVPPKTTAGELKETLKSIETLYDETLLIWDTSGSLVSDSVFVGTGFTAYMKTGKRSDFTISVRGDLNGDGRVTTADQTLLKSYIMSGSLTDTYSIEFKAADIDKNGKLNVADLMAMKNLMS